MAWRVTITRAAMGIMIILALFAVPTITAANRDLNDLVRLYSTQRIVELDINETCTFKLKDGRQRVLRLVSVEEQRDSVVDLFVALMCVLRLTANRWTCCANPAGCRLRLMDCGCRRTPRPVMAI